MAVVHKNGALYTGAVHGDPVTDGRADHRFAGGRIHSSLERVVIAVDDEATSTYQVGRLPREAVLLPGTSLRVKAAVTGTIDMGDAFNPDGLIDGYAGTANTTIVYGNNQWEVGNVEEQGKALWALLGYESREAAPPQIDLYITLVGSTQATDPADIYVNFLYTVD